MSNEFGCVRSYAVKDLKEQLLQSSVSLDWYISCFNNHSSTSTRNLFFGNALISCSKHTPQLLFKRKTINRGGVDKMLYWDETGDGEKKWECKWVREKEGERERKRESCFSLTQSACVSERADGGSGWHSHGTSAGRHKCHDTHTS